MKVLIPFDGTKYADNALLDLQAAGFGKDDEIVVAITDVWLPESADEVLKVKAERRLNLERSGTCSYAPARRRFEEERFLSSLIRKRVSSAFPMWDIRIESLPGFSLVSSEILEKASKWRPDLVVLGSQRNIVEVSNGNYRSGLWRVVSELDCSVRLARRTNYGRSLTIPDSPSRIIAVLNGSRTDEKIVTALADRRWPIESELRLVQVNRNTFPEKHKLSLPHTKVEPFKLRLPNFVNASPPENGSFKFNGRTNLLEMSGLRISRSNFEINAPPDSIIQAIRDWKPDCIFIADSTNSVGKRVSDGLATSNDLVGMLVQQAQCSIEIVRSTEKRIEQISIPTARPPASTQPGEIRNIATSLAASI